MSSSATSSTSLSAAGALGLPSAPNGDSLLTTTSTAIGMVAPRAVIFSISDCAVGMRSCSHSDLPTFLPIAARKVLAMPPPTTSCSTFSASASGPARCVFFRGFFDVFLFALFDAAFFQHDQFAFGDVEAAVGPFADQAHVLAEL